MAGLAYRLEVRQAIQLCRDLQGRFTNMQGQVLAAHREASLLAARQFENALTEKVEARAQRARTFESRSGVITGTDAPRETAHLRRALGSQGNAPYGARQVGAGYPTFLDKTPAKPYWRNLNEGTRVFVGRPVRTWGFATPGHTRIRDATNSPGRRGHGGTTVVRRPIPAYRFMEEGARRAQNVLSVEMRNIYRRHIPNFDRLWREQFGRAPSMSAGSRVRR